MSKPKLLDLFCGAGGAGMGYYRAGFEVFGVDINPQPHYPFQFLKADALNLRPSWMATQFDAIHASPPCQGYSRMRHLPWLKDKVYPLLIDPVREQLRASGLPWVIENVEGAPLAKASDLFGNHGVLLCGTMFDLGVYRHRPFETSFPVAQPAHPRHQEIISPGRMLGDRARVPARKGIGAWQEAGGVGGHMGNVDRARKAMGIDWMPGSALSQAIPPAFTKYVGEQLMAHLQSEKVPTLD